MTHALEALSEGRTPDTLLPFEELRARVGFPEYDAEARRYESD